MSKTECETIKLLPIFGSFQNDEHHFSLADESRKFFVMEDFQGIPIDLIPMEFVRYQSHKDYELLIYLGVQNVSRCNFFRKYLLSNISTLYMKYQEQVITALITMLSEIKSITRNDVNFLEFLRVTAFLPNNSSLSEREENKWMLYKG